MSNIAGALKTIDFRSKLLTAQSHFKVFRLSLI